MSPQSLRSLPSRLRVWIVEDANFVPEAVKPSESLVRRLYPISTSSILGMYGSKDCVSCCQVVKVPLSWSSIKFKKADAIRVWFDGRRKRFWLRASLSRKVNSQAIEATVFQLGSRFFVKSRPRTSVERLRICAVPN